ncbi:MAG: hypothetical protein ABFS21_09575, partial [Actinomycetota bacterium]
HRFDTASFIFGLLFVALAAAAVVQVDFPDNLGTWIVPAAVLLLGVGIAVSAIAGTSSKER